MPERITFWPGLERFFHEGLVEPGPDEHAALVRDHELEDLHPLPFCLDHFGRDHFSHHGLIGADAEPADLFQIAPVLVPPGKIGQRVFDRMRCRAF